MAVVRITVEGPAGGSAGHIDGLTRQLKADLRQVRGMSVTAAEAAAPAPRGAKSAALPDIGALIASAVFSAATINSICNVLVAYLQRTTARSVTLRREGLELTVTGLPSREQRALLERILLGGEPDPEDGEARTSVGG